LRIAYCVLRIAYCVENCRLPLANLQIRHHFCLLPFAVFSLLP
jgi:hypothetical protein